VELENRFVIIPIFKNDFNSFLGRENSDEEYLRKIQSYYSELNALRYYHFERELELLATGLNSWHPSDPKLIGLLKLFRSMLYIFIDNEGTARDYFTDIRRNEMPNTGGLFHKIYGIVNEYFNIRRKPIESLKSKAIISREFDELDIHILWKNLQLPSSWNNKIVVGNSQNNLDLVKLFSENRVLFLDGHGSNDITEGGFKYYVDSINHIRIPGPLLKLYSKNILVLGLLSCGHKPYKDYLGVSEYMILSDNTSTTTYSEMFIKVFHLTYSKTGEIELSLKMGLISLFFRSNEEFAFSIYHKGKLVEV